MKRIVLPIPKNIYDELINSTIVQIRHIKEEVSNKYSIEIEIEKKIIAKEEV